MKNLKILLIDDFSPATSGNETLYSHKTVKIYSEKWTFEGTMMPHSIKQISRK